MSRFVVAAEHVVRGPRAGRARVYRGGGCDPVGVSRSSGLLAGDGDHGVFIGVLGVRVRERDTVVGVVMAFGLGLGVLFLTLYPRYATEAFAILFGTITG